MQDSHFILGFSFNCFQLIKVHKRPAPWGKQRKKSMYDSKSPYIAKHIQCNFDLARHLSI